MTVNLSILSLILYVVNKGEGADVPHFKTNAGTRTNESYSTDILHGSCYYDVLYGFAI